MLKMRIMYVNQEKGRPLPKFGEWDVNDPASAEGFTVIFNKARDEKETGGNSRGPESPGKEGQSLKQESPGCLFSLLYFSSI